MDAASLVLHLAHDNVDLSHGTIDDDVQNTRTHRLSDTIHNTPHSAALFGLALPRRTPAGLLLLSLLCASCMSDSVEGDDERYMSDRVDADDDVDDALTPNGCDMTGTWIAQMRTRNQAIIGAELRTYNWFYYELESIGSETPPNASGTSLGRVSFRTG